MYYQPSRLPVLLSFLFLIGCADAYLPNPEPTRDDGSADPQIPVDDELSEQLEEPPAPVVSATGSTIEAVSEPDLTGVVNGNFTCLGENLPEPVTEAKQVWTGVTYQFHSSIVIPGAMVDLRAADGELLASAVSGERGEFTIEFDDTESYRGGYFEVSRPPDYVTTRLSTTHMDRAWGDELNLALASDVELSLLEMGTGVEIDLERGVIHGEIFDCDQLNEVSGAQVSIEPDAGQLFIPTVEYTFSSSLDRTTDISEFYFVNVEPGTYVVTVFATPKEGGDDVIINRAVYHVAPGVLSSQNILPE